jgi:hypothetical protein
MIQEEILPYKFNQLSITEQDTRLENLYKKYPEIHLYEDIKQKIIQEVLVMRIQKFLDGKKVAKKVNKKKLEDIEEVDEVEE